jgi:nucleoside-diphosphate-sugar epimerase
VKVAVAGGRGFIGAAACRALEAAGADVIAFGREGVPAATADALVWAAGGRADDAAVHVAAPVAAAHALGAQTIVYVSSGEVYGDAPVPFTEDGPIAPRTAYAIAKRDGERAIAAAAARAFVLRPGVVYGPDQPPRMLIPIVLAALRADRRVPLTPGDQTRDFIYVDDLASLVVRCLAADAPPGTYNAGTGREVTVREACTILAGDRAALLDFGAQPYRADEQMRYALDPTRTAAQLGWRAQTSLEDGLARVAATC